MKGNVKVGGQNEYLSETPKSSSSNLGSDYKLDYDHSPLSSLTSINQELAGKNDDAYRLFIVSLS